MDDIDLVFQELDLSLILFFYKVSNFKKAKITPCVNFEFFLVGWGFLPLLSLYYFNNDMVSLLETRFTTYVVKILTC